MFVSERCGNRSRLEIPDMPDCILMKQQTSATLYNVRYSHLKQVELVSFGVRVHDFARGIRVDFVHSLTWERDGAKLLLVRVATSAWVHVVPVNCE